MFLWNLGATTLIVRYVFRDPNMDLRFVLLGSVLPDIIDKPIGSILFHDTFGSHRIFAHTLTVPVVLLGVAMLVTSRGSALRKGLIAVVIAWFIHLVLDGVWTSPETFFWPFFGTEFPRIANSAFATLVGDMLRSPWVWLGEAAGAGYLIYLWRRYLSGAGAIMGFMRDGRISLPRP